MLTTLPLHAVPPTTAERLIGPDSDTLEPLAEPSVIRQVATAVGPGQPGCPLAANGGPVPATTESGRLTFDRAGRIVAADAGCATVFGADTGSLLGTSIETYFAGHIARTLQMAGEAYARPGSTSGRIPYRLSGVFLADDRQPNRRVDLVVCHHHLDGELRTTLDVHNVGDASRVGREMAEKLSRFITLAQLAPVGIVQLGADWSCVYVNDMWCELTELDADECERFGWIDALHPDEAEAVLSEMREGLHRDRVFRRETRLCSPLGKVVWVTFAMTALLDEAGEIDGFLLVVTDITEKHRLVERLHDLAHKDALTGLSNRASWLEALDRLLGSGGAARPVAVLYIDLDGFKAVNDTAGHDHGDELLQAVAERLADAVPHREALARLGGDEFAVVVPDAADEDAVAAIARRIVRSIGRPFTILGRETRVGASVGIALGQTGQIDRATLVKRADTALYAAKHEGRSRHVFYSPEQDRAQRERSELTATVHRAVEELAFELHYQPQICLETTRIVGFEALLRLAPKAMPVPVPAADLIDILESTGLIGEVGRWALDTACAQLADWRRSHRCAGGVTVSVNVSAKQLGLPGFAEEVERVLERHELPPTSLIIEITESMLVGTRDSDVMCRLKALGVQIALDDFGQGFSSLAYLGRLPLDHLKIDRAFIDDIASSEESRKIVRCILGLAQSLGMRVVAEGVENADVLPFLREEGCHAWQGFLHSRPADPAWIRQLLLLEDYRHTGAAEPTLDPSGT